ncbi:MAG: amidohydrolase [Anaerolineae bacterium]|nr:amidohydrolase [Anaerolineae bacterium]
MTIDYVEQALNLREKLIARRRDFHRHPELAFEETRTASIVASTLSELGLEVQTGIGKTGVVGILEGDQPGPTVLVRADMDALPIREETGAAYASETPGKMHACGHDGHTSIALGVAELLTPLRDKIHGRVKFVFQPAEEIGKGANAMVADGVMNDPAPDVSVGLHLWNSLPIGSVGMAEGPIMAGALTFNITVRGKGGHAASPHFTIDPVVCAAQIVTAFQSIVSRNMDPFESAVISVTQINAGEAYNVIPQFAELKGTVRYFRKDVYELVTRRMKQITEHIAAAIECAAEIEFSPMTQPVVNNGHVRERLLPVFENIVGQGKIDSIRTMGAEDVGVFMNDVPGVYFFVGAKDQTADHYYPHHHPRFTIDEESLPLGLALLASAVAEYVLPQAD